MEDKITVLTVETKQETDVEVQVVDHSGRLMHHGNWVCCVPCYWLRANTGVHKATLSVATLLVTSLLVASPVIFLISVVPGSDGPRDCFVQDDTDCPLPPDPAPDCTAPSCKMAATAMRRPLDWGINPCTDFSAFACSASKTNPDLQETVDRHMQQLMALNTSSGPFRKLGRFYGSCLRSTSSNTAPMFSLLIELGGYLPVGSLGPADITALVILLSEHGSGHFVDIFWDRMEQDSNSNENGTIALFIDKPRGFPPVMQGVARFGVPRLPPYLHSVFSVHKEAVLKVLEGFLPSSMGPKQKASEVNAIMGFVDDLNKLWQTPDDASLELNSTKLQELFPAFQWSLLLDSVKGNERYSIVVQSPKYLLQLGEVLRKYPLRLVHNTLLVLYGTQWMHVLKFTGHPVGCAKLTTWALPLPSAAIYCESFQKRTVDKNIKRVLKMFDKLKISLASRMGESKIALRNLKIQTTRWSVENSSKLLENVEISSDDFFKNVIKRYRDVRKFSLNLQEKQEIITFGYPFIVNTFYDKLTHSIVLPLSQLMSPYFDEVLPEYLKFATLGNVLAKEMIFAVHVSNPNTLIFPECVENHIKTILENNKMSRGMFISEMGSISLSFNAWGPLSEEERLPGLSLNPAQLYYVAAAQIRCHGTQAVILNGVMSLQRNFPDAFLCPVSAPVTPPKGCPGW